MQYFRSPKIKNTFSENIYKYTKEKNIKTINGEKIWAAIHGAIASGAANYMVYKKIHIRFLISQNERFITCDCPVVRLELAKDNTDRFYYPFSPRTALIIGTNDEDFGKEELNDDEAEAFNKLIRDNSERIVVLNNKQTLNG